MKMTKNGQFLHQSDTPTPRRRAPPRQMLLHLCRPEIGFMHFSSLPRRSNAPPRRSNAPPRRTCKLGLVPLF